MLTRLARASLLVCSLLMAGCGLFRADAGGVLTASSTDQTRALAPTFSTAVYSYTDENTAEVFLSDIPQERLDDPRDTLAGAEGVLLHLHVFLDPSPGDTPIDATACNATVRSLVLTGKALESAPPVPAMGLYAGGGFVLLRGSIGDGSLSGSVTGGSYRMTRSTPAFADRLGSGSITGRFSATLDPDRARMLSARFESLVRRMPAPPIEPEPGLKPMPIKVKPGT